MNSGKRLISGVFSTVLALGGASAKRDSVAFLRSSERISNRSAFEKGSKILRGEYQLKKADVSGKCANSWMGGKMLGVAVPVVVLGTLGYFYRDEIRGLLAKDTESGYTVKMKLSLGDDGVLPLDFNFRLGGEILFKDENNREKKYYMVFVGVKSDKFESERVEEVLGKLRNAEGERTTWKEVNFDREDGRVYVEMLTLPGSEFNELYNKGLAMTYYLEFLPKFVGKMVDKDVSNVLLEQYRTVFEPKFLRGVKKVVEKKIKNQKSS